MSRIILGVDFGDRHGTCRGRSKHRGRRGLIRADLQNALPPSARRQAKKADRSSAQHERLRRVRDRRSAATLRQLSGDRDRNGVYDERLTTVSAHRVSFGYRSEREEAQESVDELSATLILRL